MIRDYQKDDFIQNPCHLLMEADTSIAQLAVRSWFEALPGTKKQAATYKDAIDRVEKAIALKPIFAFTAQVHRAHFLIDKEQSTNLYKVKAKSYLLRAQEILGTNILPQLHSMQLETKTSEEELVFDDLAQQIRVKVEILQVYQSYVSQAISSIEDWQKLTNVIETDRVTINKKLYRDEVKALLDRSSGTINLIFHNLTYYQDVWKADQAMNLLGLLSKEDENCRTEKDHQFCKDSIEYRLSRFQ